MKNYILICLFLATLQSCKQNVTKADLSKLNGYWEIEKVILPNGEKKEYKVNEFIDYIEIKEFVGFRKKVYPQFDGKYLINNTQEILNVSTKEGVFYLNYSTPYTKWKEEIVKVEDSSFVVKNAQDLEYHYKKSIPYSIK